jgi:antitoxin component of MazEF toxin-antitoxin module
MSATIIDKKHRMTLPNSICAAVGLKPNDQVEWRVQDGEIRGRKLVA